MFAAANFGGDGGGAYLRSLIGASSRRMCVARPYVQQLLEIMNDDMVTAICGRIVPDIRADGLRLGFREFDTIRPSDPDKEREFEESWRQLSYDEPWHQLVFGWSVKRRVSVANAVAAENASRQQQRLNGPGSGGSGGALSADAADDIAAGGAFDIPTAEEEEATRKHTDAPFIINPLLYSLQWEDTANAPRHYVAVDLYNRVMTDVVIHVSAHPCPVTGRPTSPTAKLLHWLLLRRQLFLDAGYCSYWASHNTLAVQTVGVAATPNPNDTEYYAEGLVREEQHLYQRLHQDVTAMSYDAAVGRLHNANVQSPQAYQAAYGTAPGSALYAAAMSSGAPMAQPPYQRALVLGPGKQLAPVPAPVIPAQIAFVMEQLNAAVMNVFGIMPNMLVNSGARVVAQAENDRMLYETKKQEWQSLVEQFLTDTYNRLYDDTFVKYAAQLEQAIRGEAYDQLRGKRGIRKTIIREVRQNVRAVITIARHPPATLEEVQVLADRGWIAEQTAAEAAVRIVGLSPSSVTTDEERRKTREQTQNEEVELTERMSIAAAAGKPPAGASGGGGAKRPPSASKSSAAKKTKASGSSSSATGKE